MHVEVALIQDLVPADLASSVSTVVIDVLRATTTVVFALEAGCDVVTPAGTVEDARSLAASSAALLAGERGGVPLDGFDLGNSPPDFTPERCGGRPVVLTTTNGTQAVRRCLGAQSVWAAALVNAEATARALVESGTEEVLLVCAGSGGEMAADDVAAAGCIAGSLALQGAATPGDGARIAAAMFDTWKHDLRGLLRRSLSGQKLVAAGLDGDLDACARVDSVPLAVKLDSSGGFRRV